MKKKRVAILGSTGSIGVNALKVIERHSDQFEVVALTAFNNVDLLIRQIEQFRPRHVAVGPKGLSCLEKQIISKNTKLWDARSEIGDIVALPEVDIVILAIQGTAALLPFLNAVRNRKTVAPANKEALVMAGHILMAEAKKYGVTIIPVDSEQSAIFQCLEGRNRKDLKRILLTASGGALRCVKKSSFSRLTVQQVLSHPRWKMGKKITIDSATLMNKGLEVIEARWLFDVPVDEIDVVIHPEAIIHSMVEFQDGSILAQLGVTDMRLPIQYALTFPQRFPTGLKTMDFVELKQLTFEKPDFRKFPALELCFVVGRKGGTLPAVLNAANEEAVSAFLSERIRFTKIVQIVEKVVSLHRGVATPTLNEVLSADQWAREKAKSYIPN